MRKYDWGRKEVKANFYKLYALHSAFGKNRTFNIIYNKSIYLKYLLGHGGYYNYSEYSYIYEMQIK